jgi:hypothetical protein
VSAVRTARGVWMNMPPDSQGEGQAVLALLVSFRIEKSLRVMAPDGVRTRVGGSRLRCVCPRVKGHSHASRSNATLREMSSRPLRVDDGIRKETIGGPCLLDLQELPPQVAWSLRGAFQ